MYTTSLPSTSVLIADDKRTALMVASMKGNVGVGEAIFSYSTELIIAEISFLIFVPT